MAISLGISGHALAGDIGLIIGASAGAMFGVRGINFERERRAKIFPDLISPESNSTLRYQEIPTSIDGTLYPPVYWAKTLADWIAFRDANKEIVLKWAEKKLPPVSTSPIGYFIDEGPVNSLVVLPDVQHYPARDPENSPSIHLEDRNIPNGAKIHTFPTDPILFWNQGSRFSGEGLGIADKVLPDKQWVAFKENSWSRSVVILDQYQSSAKTGTEQSLDSISIENRYWLIHVYGEGIKNTRRKRATQAKPVMIAEPNPGNI